MNQIGEAFLYAEISIVNQNTPILIIVNTLHEGDNLYGAIRCIITEGDTGERRLKTLNC